MPVFANEFFYSLLLEPLLFLFLQVKKEEILLKSKTEVLK